MRYLFKFMWWIMATILMIFELLIFTLANFFIILWYVNLNHQLTWKRYRRRKIRKNVFYTQKNIIVTYKQLLNIDDVGDFVCNDNCEPIS